MTEVAAREGVWREWGVEVVGVGAEVRRWHGVIGLRA